MKLYGTYGGWMFGLIFLVTFALGDWQVTLFMGVMVAAVMVLESVSVFSDINTPEHVRHAGRVCWNPQAPEPDANCITLPDGSCIATDCMHTAEH